MPPKVKVDTDQIEDAADVFGSQVAPDVFDAASIVGVRHDGRHGRQRRGRRLVVVFL